MTYLRGNPAQGRAAFRAAQIVGACFAFFVSLAHVKDRLKQGDGVFESGLGNRRQITQILGEHLVSVGLQMRCFGATEELLTLKTNENRSVRTGQSELANRRQLANAISFAVVERQVRMYRWMRVPAVYLALANRRLLAFFALCEINNLRSLNRAFSPIPTPLPKSQCLTGFQPRNFGKY